MDNRPGIRIVSTNAGCCGALRAPFPILIQINISPVWPCYASNYLPQCNYWNSAPACLAKQGRHYNLPRRFGPGTAFFGSARWLAQLQFLHAVAQLAHADAQLPRRPRAVIARLRQGLQDHLALGLQQEQLQRHDGRAAMPHAGQRQLPSGQAGVQSRHRRRRR